MPNALPISRMVGGIRARERSAMKARISSRGSGGLGIEMGRGNRAALPPAPSCGLGFVLMSEKILHICAGVKGWGEFLGN
jgi:hypothetical protein